MMFVLRPRQLPLLVLVLAFCWQLASALFSRRAHLVESRGYGRGCGVCKRKVALWVEDTVRQYCPGRARCGKLGGSQQMEWAAFETGAGDADVPAGQSGDAGEPGRQNDSENRAAPAGTTVRGGTI